MTETRVAQAEIDQGWVEDFARRWEAAWNSHRPEKVLELLTDDVVYDDSGWPTTMRGHGDARAFMESIWRAFPDMTFETIDGPYLTSGQPKAAFHWRGTGTFTGPLDPPGFAPTGQRIEFEGADLHEFRDGRVCRLRTLFDEMDLARQLGLFPKPGSAAEKAAAAAQRLAVEIRDRLRR